MLLHPTQRQVAADTHRYRVLCCGRRWGKTTLAVEEIKGKALSREARIAYIAPTYQQARDIAWQMLIRELKPIIIRANESRLEIIVKNLQRIESIIQLRGWEAIETLRGQAFDFVIIDEVAMMRDFWSGWEEVIAPTLTDRIGEAMFISTPRGFNHFYDLFNKEHEDPNFKSFRYTSYDNPHLPVEELDRQRELLTEDRFAQEILADFRKTQGLVYKEFNREKHISKDEPKHVVRQVCGVDWGYTNPAGILRIRIDHDSHYWIDEEFYRTHQTTEQIIQAIKAREPQAVYPDPAEPDRNAELTRAGLYVMEVSKDITAGIAKVRELLKQNRIHIHPSCKNLLWELETYRYPNKKPDKNEPEKPIKENDHLVDAMRYAIFSCEISNQPQQSEPKLIKSNPITYS